ncbi:MAG: hypothetical protein IPM60_05725 [Rhodospirillales bacterium]|nr:hypothetical protein [Rhodospirillales bacterium]
MRLAITSVAGHPLDVGTWSAAPANLSAALKRRTVDIVAVDSSLLTRIDKAVMAAGNSMRGYPWNAVSWFAPARQRRGAYVAERARRAGADHVLCTGSLDVPLGTDVPYSIWMDNTWNLLRNSRVAPRFSTTAMDEVDRLERSALAGAATVLTFSAHVRDDVVAHYEVPSERVFAVGCGSGELAPFEGEKDYANGHLLLVAKHLFAEKGGEIVLAAL